MKSLITPPHSSVRTDSPSAPPQRGRRSSKAVLLPFLLIVLSPGWITVPALNRSAGRASPEQLQALQSYVKNGWHTLMRSNSQLAEAAVDPKFPVTGRRPVYVARS